MSQFMQEGKSLFEKNPQIRLAIMFNWNYFLQEVPSFWKAFVGISYEYLPGWPEPAKEEIIRLCLCHISYLHQLLKLYMSQTKISINSRSSHQRCSIEKAVLRNFSIFSGKHLCWSLFLIQACNFIKRDSNKVFSCEYCEIFKNTYSKENLPRTTSRIPTSY